MAISGLVLTGFVFGHLVGNLQIFLPPDHINGYAHFLQSLGSVLWLVRAVLLVAVVLHVWAAVALTVESRIARGPHQAKRWIRATWASRTMRWTGLIVFFFILYHLAHFTIGIAGHDTFKTQLTDWTMQHDVKELGITLAKEGEVVHDVYSMIFLGFLNPVVSLFYIIATSLLSVHLLHGIDSFFQTIGWRNGTWAGCLRKVVAVLCLLYFIGNLLIPGAILSGALKPAAGTDAAAKLAQRQASISAPVTAQSVHVTH